MQQHSCHNSSQQGSIIGGLHHVVDSSRLTKSQTGDIHYHVNPRCIDVARYARGSDHGEHPRSEDKPRKPPIESNPLGSISLGSISRALSDQHTAPQKQQFVDISADERAPGLHSYRARTAGRAHSECRPGATSQWLIRLTLPLPGTIDGFPPRPSMHPIPKFLSNLLCTRLLSVPLRQG